MRTCALVGVWRMAEIVYLTRDGRRPKSGEWRIVSRDPSRAYSAVRRNETLYNEPFPENEAEQKAVIERAKQWADKHGISAVYVVAK